eukprot:9296436-Alexandrium_andersonii.AAC.1
MPAATRWLVARSCDRRWWPADGTEWAAVRAVRGVTQASHVAWLIGNGVRGRSALRSTVARQAHPQTCICGGADE